LALDTLALDGTLRTQRVTQSFLPSISGPTVAAGPAKVHRTIHDGHHTEGLPGALVRAEGQPAGSDNEVNEAYDGVAETFDFYLEIYQRNSIDDHGLPLVATVHYGRRFDNAFWNGEQMVFGDGDGTLFNRFTISLDVIGHELTHGVTGSEVNLRYLRQ